MEHLTCISTHGTLICCGWRCGIICSLAARTDLWQVANSIENGDKSLCFKGLQCAVWHQIADFTLAVGGRWKASSPIEVAPPTNENHPPAKLRNPILCCD